YFENIFAQPDLLNPLKLHLVFQRNPSAGRFWKDVMVSILNTIRTEVGGVTITIGWKGNSPPSFAPTSMNPNTEVRVSEWFDSLGDDSKSFWVHAARYLLNHPSFTFDELSSATNMPKASLESMHR